MADNLGEPDESNPIRREPRFPPWVKGVIWGMAFWASLWLTVELVDAIQSDSRDFFLLELVDYIEGICGLMAFPIALLGWMFIWGDNGPPFWWLKGIAFHIGFGLVLYGLLGAVIGRWIGKRRGGSGS